MLIDWHTHAWRPEHLGPVWGPLLDKACAPAIPSHAADGPDHRAALAAAGVERWAVIGLHIAQIGLQIPNDYVAQQVAQAEGRAIGVASVDPTVPGAVEELERAVRDLGLVGLKLSPPYQGFHPDDDRAWPVYEKAAELGIFLMFHQSSVFIPTASQEFANPTLLDKVARTFPRTPVWIAHLGKPWYGDLVELMVKNKNVYTDVSAVLGKTWSLYGALRQAVEARVTDRILFGTDFPVYDVGRCVEQLEALPDLEMPLPIPREVVEAILHDRPFDLLVRPDTQ